jgi:hypothetical protein
LKAYFPTIQKELQRFEEKKKLKRELFFGHTPYLPNLLLIPAPNNCVISAAGKWAQNLPAF